MMNPIAALIVQKLAFDLASFPESAIGDAPGAVSSTMVNGIRAARAAFAEHVSEVEAKAFCDRFLRETCDEIEDGLRELDEKTNR